MSPTSFNVPLEHLDFKNIFILSDLHFGVRANSLEWLQNHQKYFRDFYIPYLKKNVKPGDILFILGDWFDNRQLLDIYVMNTSINIVMELSEILPVHFITGNHDIYKKYGTDIQNNLNSQMSAEDRTVPWKKAFLDFEVRRYQQAPDFWEPLAVELYLRNDSLCGKIDRIDQVDKQGHCRVVEYKSLPGEFDEEELLFYSFLLTTQLPTQELLGITNVSEIGVYYYTSKEYFTAQVTADILASFSDHLEEIRAKMMNPHLIKKKKGCDFATTKCLYREICQRIHIKQQKIIGLPKT